MIVDQSRVSVSAQEKISANLMLQPELALPPGLKAGAELHKPPATGPRRESRSRLALSPPQPQYEVLSNRCWRRTKVLMVGLAGQGGCVTVLGSCSCKETLSSRLVLLHFVGPLPNDFRIARESFSFCIVGSFSSTNRLWQVSRTVRRLTNSLKAILSKCSSAQSILHQIGHQTGPGVTRQFSHAWVIHIRQANYISA